jgi:hypothetical protein
MKKWFYVLFPTALLALFLVFYLSSREGDGGPRGGAQGGDGQGEGRGRRRRRRPPRPDGPDDAERRNVERAAEEAKAAKDKEDKYNAEMARIKADTDKSNASAEKYAKEVSDLTIELDNLNKQKDRLTREAFELDKKIELPEVARHNAELEIQRYDPDDRRQGGREHHGQDAAAPAADQGQQLIRTVFPEGTGLSSC